MSNIFDQFDTSKGQPQATKGQPQTKNIFDQFDTKQSGQVQPKSLQNQPQTKNIFDQFDALAQAQQSHPQSGNVFDQFDAPVQPEQAVQQPQQQQKDSSWWDDLKDMATGDSRMTPEMQKLSEIGDAPEMNAMSWPAFKTSLGLLATGNEDNEKKIIKANIPSATFSEDSAGNTIVNLPSGQYALNKPGISGQDIAKGLFDIAAFTPAGRGASIAGVAAKSAATEAALQEAARQTGAGDIDLKDVALSGAIGGAGKGIESALGAGYRALRGVPEKETTELIQEAERVGVPLTTSDVIPPTTKPGRFAKDIGEAVPVVGTAGIREAQQEARQQAAETFAQRYTPDYEEIKRSIKGKAAGIKKAAINSRQRVVEQVENVQTPSANTVEAIDNEISRLTTLPGGQPRQNVDQAMVDTLERYKSDIQTGGDFKTLDDLRTTLREDMSPDFTKSGTRQEGAIKRIYGSMTKDMDEVVKENLSPQEFRQWKRGNAVYGQEMEKLKKSRIKNVLNAGEDLSPEQIDRTLMNKDSVVRQRMYQSLDSKGRDNARAAIVSNMFDNASPGGELSVNRLINEMNRKKGALDTFFKGAERKELEGLRKVLDATRGAQDASVVTKTGQTIAPYIGTAGAITATLPTVMTALGAGGLTRAYESKIFRNALTRLANTKKGSSKFESALSDITEYLTLSAQAARRSDNNQEQ
jgi:hypothetical protein